MYRTLIRVVAIWPEVPKIWGGEGFFDTKQVEHGTNIRV